jgi:hypothetical protein
MDVSFALQAFNGGIRSKGEAPAEKLLANVDGEPICPATKMADPPEQLSSGQHGPPRRVSARGNYEPNHSSILDIDPITCGVPRQVKAEVIADEGASMRSPEDVFNPLGKALDIDVYERVEIPGGGIADQLLPHEHASSSSIWDVRRMPISLVGAARKGVPRQALHASCAPCLLQAASTDANHL